VLPSGLVMARNAFGGWAAGTSFVLLSLLTAYCTIRGIIAARQRRFAQHRIWMTRSFLLMGSAIVLRLVSGALETIGVESPVSAYICAAWTSWIIPITAYELLRKA
jgi:hypothetical protein